MLKVIEEFPNYSIDLKGNVYNNTTGKRVKAQINIDGYRVVNLYKEGVGSKTYHRRCARLVGLTHLKNSYFKGAVINHKDLNKTNDSVDNLEWVTTRDNNIHSIQNQPLKHTRGSSYTEGFIREVCSMIEDGVRNKDIIDRTGVTFDALTKIRSGASWSWISKDYVLTPSRRGVSENTVKWVCHRLLEGESVEEILKKSECKNLTKGIIKRIKSKKTWKKITEVLLEDYNPRDYRKHTK